VQAQAQENIYIGKGKYVKDDPNKYPSKNEWTGGWAGGEAGLWDFRDAIDVRTSWSPGLKEVSLWYSTRNSFSTQHESHRPCVHVFM
jgi:hypothetical protein